MFVFSDNRGEMILNYFKEKFENVSARDKEDIEAIIRFVYKIISGTLYLKTEYKEEFFKQILSCLSDITKEQIKIVKASKFPMN